MPYDITSEWFDSVEDSAAPLACSDWELVYRSAGDSFFEVYRGTKDGVRRAFKGLKAAFRESDLHRAMLRKEYDISHSLNHPYIVETVAWHEESEIGPCIEMAWIEGVTLSAFIKEGRPDEDTFLRIADNLCAAVEYLHARGIIHRDIKPSNIIITQHGQFAKLIDFGLADGSNYQLFKGAAGTREYLSPELLEGSEPTIKSDIFALGKVLELLTGKHARTLRKCTAADPQKRFEYAEEISAALRSHSAPIVPFVVLLFLAGILATGWYFRNHLRTSFTPAPDPETIIDTLQKGDTMLPPPVVPQPQPVQPRAEKPKQATTPVPKKDSVRNQVVKKDMEELDKLMEEVTDLFD